ncbi:MAG: M3 family oligoendopeptidase [Lachnospirales bacterium]
MNTKWKLDNIYKSVESEEFKKDISLYKEEIKNLNNWCDINFKNYGDVVNTLEEYIVRKNKLQSYEKLGMYVALALSVDTTNEKLLKTNDIIEEIEGDISYHETLAVMYIKEIGDINIIIEKSPILKEHKYFIKTQRELSKHTLSPKEEGVISKMRATGSSMWQKMWEQLTSNLLIQFNSKKEPLSKIRNYAYSEDKNIRKSAYLAELEGYKSIEVPVSFCLNGIKGEVITTSKLKGYKSPLEMTLFESRIDNDILKAMFDAIDEKLPDLRKYFYKKAELLGYGKSLPFYELFAPVGKSNLSYTIEEARDFVINSFYGFSKDLGDFAKYAFENNWLDLMPNEGKVGGAFCETIHSIKESRILTNFGGTFNDVVTIAHELGHAFHNTRLFNNTELNSFYPMPIAETASTFCETIIINEALKTASPEDKQIIIENDLQGLTQCIVDIYSRFLFEDSVFKKRAEGSLSLNELKNIMEDAQLKSYGDGLDKNYLHNDMWVCKPHYYDADFNYYNFPYAFGALLSKGLYGIYKEIGKDFIPLYDKFLAESSKNDLADVAKIAGIDLYSKDFWKKGLEIIINEIDEM